MTAAVLRARLLGRFEVSVDGRHVDRSAFERPSGARLLKLLLATPGHRVRREAAAELLWPEADPDRSGANLRKAIFFARRALEGDEPERESLIRSDAESLWLDDRAELDVDSDRLRAAADVVRAGGAGSARGAAAAALEVVADLAGERLLPDDPYEEWLVPIRERLGQLTLDALQRGAAAARAAGDHQLAFRLVDRTLALEPADEAAHRTAIELYLEAGQLHAARRQLVACARALAETFGVEPPPELGRLIEAAAAARAGVPILAGEPPIIGRRRELEAAEAALDAVSEGRLGVALYRGAAGIGKTRVLRELARGAAAGGWRIVEARGLESSPGAAFGDLGAALAAALSGSLPADLPEPGRSALQAISPAFGGLPAVTFASDAALTSGLLDGLAALAVVQPLVLALDDVQWLDRATVELLDAALAGLAQAPLLLVGTVRDAPDPLPRAVAALLEDVERAGGRIVQLGPVGRREIEQLLERELGARAEPALVEAVAERSGGAPLFALEVARAARDGGAIVERGGAWRVASPETALPVPSGVGLMVAKRAEGLPDRVSRILMVAAELGDDVSLERLLAATAPASPEDVLDALDAGIGAGLLVERAGGYGFAHPLFRSALRGAVRPRERASLHLRVARALAAGIDPTDQPAIEAALTIGRDVVGIASHALQAAETGSADAAPYAIAFGFAAGDRHAALFDHRAAIAVIERALGLWSRLPAAATAGFPAARAALQLGWSRHAIDDEPGASAAFRAAIEYGRDEAEQASGWQALAWMPYQHGRFDAADAILRDALPTVRDPVVRAGIEADRAWIRGRKGDWAGAYEALRVAVPILESGASPALVARSLDRLGVAMRDAVDPEGSITVMARALRIALEIRDPRLAATIHMHMAGAYRQFGRLDAAVAEIDAALASCAMTGDRYIEAVTVWTAADIEHARGNFAGAVQLRRRELELLERLGGNPHNQAMSHAHLSFLLRKLGDPTAAVEEIRLARLIAAHSGQEHLPGRIEEALASTTWFIEDLAKREA